MRDAGVLECLSRGLYRIADLPPLTNPDLVAVALKVPTGVICLISALAVHGLEGRNALAWGVGLGAAGYLVGLLVSGLTDLPSGPAVVCALALVSALAGWGLKRLFGHGQRENARTT